MSAANQESGHSAREVMVAVGACEPEDVAALPALLHEMGVHSRLVTSVGELDELLRKVPVSAIFAHVSPSQLEFFTLLERRGLPPFVPLLSGADHGMYAAAVNRGAFDCLALPTPKAELERVLALALEGREAGRWSPTGASGAENGARSAQETEATRIWLAREKWENERKNQTANAAGDDRARTTNGFEQTLLNGTRRPH